MNSKKRYICTNVLAVICWACPAARADNESNSSEVDLFRLYLTKSPCFSKLIYTDQTVCGGNSFQNREFVAAYSSSGFYLRHYTAKDNIDDVISFTNKMHGTMLVGRQNDLRWQINGFGVGKSISQDANTPDAYASFADSMRIILDGIVNFGPQEIRPGSFVWHGNEFEAKPSVLMQQMRPDVTNLTGAIIIQNGRVVQMDVQLYGHLASRFNYQYEYSSNRPSWFPAKIVRAGADKCKFVQVQGVVFGAEYEVMREFSPEAHIAQQLELVTLVSNNVVLAKPEGSNPDVVALVKIQNADGIKNTSRVLMGWPAIFVRLVLALLFIVPIIFFAAKLFKMKSK